MYTEDELYHHGIIGQKWGIRRYQNKDGSLTPAGKKNINKQFSREIKTGKSNYTNRAIVDDKIKNDIMSTTEYANMLKRNGKIIQTKDNKGRVIRSNISYFHSPDAETTIKWINEDIKTEDAFDQKRNDILKKYIDEYAGSTLKDFGYESTQSGIEYLKQMGIAPR